MSCSINRYKFVGSSITTKENTESTNELETRMKEMLEVRANQDNGKFQKVVQPAQQKELKLARQPGGTTLFNNE